MKKTLPSLRIEEETLNNVIGAIKKHNENSISKLTIQEFRRVALEFLSQLILRDRKDILKEIQME
jgi:hypothetical protein